MYRQDTCIISLELLPPLCWKLFVLIFCLWRLYLGFEKRNVGNFYRHKQKSAYWPLSAIKPTVQLACDVMLHLVPDAPLDATSSGQKHKLDCFRHRWCACSFWKQQESPLLIKSCEYTMSQCKQIWHHLRNIIYL